MITKSLVGLSSLLILSGMSAFYSSCQHEVLPTVNPDSLCFERDVLPIFTSNCAMSGCHDAISREDGYELTNYATITQKGIKAGNAKDSKIWESIEDGSMPQNGTLTSLQKSIIKTWIESGALNGINCVSSCDSNSFSFSKNISGIISTNCLGCHRSPNPSGGVDLNGYDAVKSSAQSGILLHALKGTNGYVIMPPYPTTPISDCQITQINKWINNGYKND